MSSPEGTTMRPYDVKGERDLRKLARDNYPAKNTAWSILVSGDHVSLHSPAGAIDPPFFFRIPRKQFNEIVDWYTADQKARQKNDRITPNE